MKLTSESLCGEGGVSVGVAELRVRFLIHVAMVANEEIRPRPKYRTIATN